MEPRAYWPRLVERPYRYVRRDFFLARTFRDLDDLNAQFDGWRSDIANARVHATTGRVVVEHFAEERPALTAHPAVFYSAVFTVVRRVSPLHEVLGHGVGRRQRLQRARPHPPPGRRGPEPPQGGPDLRGRVLVAAHPVLEGKNRRRVDPAHRKAPPARAAEAPPPGVGRRPLAFYDAVGRRLAATETTS